MVNLAAFALLLLLFLCPARPEPLHGLRCRSLPAKAGSTDGDKAAYNPAAAWHPERGWVLAIRATDCGTLHAECDRKAALVVANMGTDADAPDHGLIGESWTEWSFDRRSFGRESGPLLVEDVRPFTWRGEVFATHVLDYKVGLARLDFDRRSLVSVWYFSLGFDDMRKVEKNWAAVVPPSGDLLLLYSVLPVTTVLRYTGTGTGTERLHTHRLPPDLDLSKSPAQLDPRRARNSGHPVRVCWKGDKAACSYLAMVHTRWFHGSGYRNWAVLLDGDDMRVTHVSAGPVLSYDQFSLRGYGSALLVVSSLHALGDTLRVYFGEGDKFGCWHDLPIGDIVWFDVRRRTTGQRTPA